MRNRLEITGPIGQRSYPQKVCTSKARRGAARLSGKIEMCSTFCRDRKYQAVLSLFRPRKVKACRDLLPWFFKICKLYFWEKFEWRENMPWVFPVALLSYVKASNEVFVNDCNIAVKAGNNDLLISFYVCNILCKNLIRVCGAWPIRRSSEFAEKPD